MLDTPPSPDTTALETIRLLACLLHGKSLGVRSSRYRDVRRSSMTSYDPPINSRNWEMGDQLREAVLTTGCEGDLKQNQSCRANPAARVNPRLGMGYATLLYFEEKVRMSC